jgi:hypothetical protein
MYDNGNQVSAGGSALTYGDNCETQNSGGQSYSMDIVSNGISVMLFDEVGPGTSVSISGNLGSDGGGSVGSGAYDYDGWHAYWKQIHSATDSSVTHLWITDAPNANHVFDSGTYDDTDAVNNVGGFSLMYFLWGVPGGAQTSDSQFQSVARAAVDALQR